MIFLLSAIYVNKLVFVKKQELSDEENMHKWNKIL